MSFVTITSSKGFNLKELDNVSNEDVIAITTLFEGLASDDVDASVLGILAPEVYDPSIVAKHLVLVQKFYDEKNVGNFTEDLKFLIGAQVMKGSITKNNFARLSDEGKKVIADKMKNFSLVAKISSTNKRTGVTLQRLAGSFPVISVKYAEKIGRSFYGKRSSHLLPKVFMTQQMACLLPVEETPVAAMLKAAVMAFSCDQTAVITKSDEKLEEKQAPFINAMMMSTSVLMGDRVATLKSLGVDKGYAGVVACLTAIKVPVVSEDEWKKYFA